jgi:hypothetical protein
MEEPSVPLLTSSMERLSRLIEKAEPVLEAALPAETSGSLLPKTPQPDLEGIN